MKQRIINALVGALFVVGTALFFWLSAQPAPAQTQVFGSAPGARMTWFGLFVGSFGSSTGTSQGATWEPSRPITITRFDVALGTAPAGCTTWPTIGLYDATTSTWLYTASLSGPYYSFRNAVTNVTVPAGDNLTLGVEGADSGCTTQPGYAQITVEYAMR